MRAKLCDDRCSLRLVVDDLRDSSSYSHRCPNLKGSKYGHRPRLSSGSCPHMQWPLPPHGHVQRLSLGAKGSVSDSDLRIDTDTYTTLYSI